MLNRNSPTPNDQTHPTIPITPLLAPHWSPHSPQ
jgi:hypothetical protein